MMDAFEATGIVISRVRSLDPENALKILEYVLIHDEGKKIMITLASSPDEALFSNRLNQVKAHLGLCSNSTHYPRPLNPLPYSMPSAAFSPPNSPIISIPSGGIPYCYGSPSRSTPAEAATHPFGRSSPISHVNQSKHGPRNELSSGGKGAAKNSWSRQIYLRFKPESTFTEEDAIIYFGQFGTVHSVNIPDLEERRFGFVKFFLPETVERVLAEENPHYVAGSCVYVRPFKEKKRTPHKKQLQQQNQHLERGEPSSSIVWRPQPNLPSFQAGIRENVVASSDGPNPYIMQEFDEWQETTKADYENSVVEEIECISNNNVSDGQIDEHVNGDGPFSFESLKHLITGDLLASLSKPEADNLTAPRF